MIVLGLVVVAVVLGASALDTGEVVQLVTEDGRHREHETPLWIVELDGATYLRSFCRESGWIDRLERQPHVTLLRGSEREELLALVVDDPRTRERVDSAMARKYGLAERLFRWVARLGGADDDLPVRLHPAARGGGARS